ncbi:MAG: hypothetical protein WBW89_16975 [Candidatus Cybelea sp.]
MKARDKHGLGALQWDGKYMAIGNTNDNMVYRLRILGTKAEIAGSTELTDASGVEDFSIPKLGSGKRNPQGIKVVGPDNLGGNVKIWEYPAGGTSIKTIEGPVEPVGTAISPAER